jgi:hypothetical protein
MKLAVNSLFSISNIGQGKNIPLLLQRPASIMASATFGYSASPDNVTMALQ